jgi:hypothetical protein
MLVALAEFASLARPRRSYNDVLRGAIRGTVPGARRIGGRWFVEIPDSTAAAPIPPEVNALRTVAAPLELRPLRPGVFSPRAA